MMHHDKDNGGAPIAAYSDGGMARQRRHVPEGDGHSYAYTSLPRTSAQHISNGGPAEDDDHRKKYGNGGSATFPPASLRASLAARSIFQGGGCIDEECGVDEGPGGRYYRDPFNDHSWSCTFGTGEENGIWMNTIDQAGTIMAFLVWILLVYTAWTFSALAVTGGVPPILSMAYNLLCVLALASHAKTTFTDPGSVPQSAVPNERTRREMGTPDQPLSMCSQCQTFKPPLSHHCRICNRCVTRMDHHCPWMNNCVGAGNLKHFVLFLMYTWSCSAYALILLGWNYFLCLDEECTFTPVLVQLVRAVTVLSFGSLLFTSSMIMNVTFGLMTGIGTIDRLKKKANSTFMDAIEEPIPLKDVFGIGPYWTWFLPIDPVLEDYDRVMGYSTPQRLLREEMQDPTSAAKGDLLTF